MPPSHYDPPSFFLSAFCWPTSPAINIPPFCPSAATAGLPYLVAKWLPTECYAHCWWPFYVGIYLLLSYTPPSQSYLGLRKCDKSVMNLLHWKNTSAYYNYTITKVLSICTTRNMVLWPFKEKRVVWRRPQFLEQCVGGDMLYFVGN